MLKGQAGPTVQLTLLGGTVGETTLNVSDMPQFLVGIAMSRSSRHLHAVSPLVGLHGRFGLFAMP